MNPADQPPRIPIDERDPIRVKRNRILRLVQALQTGSFMWLSDMLEAGREAGLEAWETVRQMTDELDLVAVVSVEWSPRSGELPRAEDVLMTPLGDLHLPVVPGFASRRAGKVKDRFKPFEADLLAGRDVRNLEMIALAWEERMRAEKGEQRGEMREQRGEMREQRGEIGDERSGSR